MQERKRGGWPPLFRCVCLRSHTEKGTTGLSLKKNFKNGREKERWVASIVPLCVCLRSHTEKGTTGLSLKKNFKNGREKERWVAYIVPLCVCLSEVTHRKMHNRFKSKKLEEREVGGLHCSAVCLSVCLRSNTAKGTTCLSLKNWK